MKERVAAIIGIGIPKDLAEKIFVDAGYPEGVFELLSWAGGLALTIGEPSLADLEKDLRGGGASIVIQIIESPCCGGDHVELDLGRVEIHSPLGVLSQDF